MKKILLALAALTLGSPALAAVPNPPPLASNESIVDAADILTPAQEVALEAKIRSVYDTSHHHIVVLTMPTLNGYPVQDYINNAFRFYKIGNKTRNDGVLLLVSMSNPRRLQIETGYGLEGVLTDYRSKEITDSMVPIMKSGDFNGGINRGVDGIAQTIAQEVVTPQQLAVTTGKVKTPVQKSEDSDALMTFFLIFGMIGVALFIWVVCFLRPRWKREEEERQERDRQRYLELVKREEERRAREEATLAAAAIQRERERIANRTLTERIGESLNIKPRKPAAPVGRTTTSNRSSKPTPTPSPAPKKSSSSSSSSSSRRNDDSWSSSSYGSSSSSSSSWGSSSSSSSWDSGSSSSYDSGGSSGGGGGGSDW